MTVYIELTTDLFDQVLTKNSNALRSSHRAGQGSVRRPTRGLEIKDDTYAILKVIDVAGNPVNVFDSSAMGGRGENYANFILQSVTESRMEKQQIIETFGESYIFFFGESPRFLDVTATLLNSNDFNWEAEWWQNYDAYFRGSKLTERGARLYMFYDDNIVEGYMLNAQATKESTPSTLMVQLQFKLFVTNTKNVSVIASDDFPIRGSAQLPIGTSLTDGTSYQTLFDNSQNASNTTGAAEAAAYQAIQQQALSSFGGAGTLAAVLAAGYDSALGAELGIAAGVTSGGNPFGGVTLSSTFAAATSLSAGSSFFNTSVPGGSNPGLIRTTPLRDKIYKNVDEWTGAPILDNNANFKEPTKISDVESLPYASFLLLGAYGVIIDGPPVVATVRIGATSTTSVSSSTTGHASLQALGMAPRFTPPGVGIGSGANVSAVASFGLGTNTGLGVSASGNASFSFGALTSSAVGGATGANASLGANVGASSSLGPNGPYAASYDNSYLPSPIAVTTPYSNYPGYGSGYGSGLPGVQGGYSAGARLGIGASAGISLGDSFGGGIGTTGGGVQVGGTHTCFSFDAFPGTLVPIGDAYLEPDGTINLVSYYAGPDGPAFAPNIEPL